MVSSYETSVQGANQAMLLLIFSEVSNPDMVLSRASRLRLTRSLDAFNESGCAQHVLLAFFVLNTSIDLKIKSFKMLARTSLEIHDQSKYVDRGEWTNQR